MTPTNLSFNCWILIQAKPSPRVPGDNSLTTEAFFWVGTRCKPANPAMISGIWSDALKFTNPSHKPRYQPNRQAFNPAFIGSLTTRNPS